MEMTFRRFTPPRFRPKNDKLNVFKAITVLLLLIALTGMFVVAYANTETLPVTGFDQFDEMYRSNMREPSQFVDDVMGTVNEIIFTLIKLEMRFVGIFLLFLCITAASFALMYAAKPEFADEVSEVKMRKAGGEQIPIDDVKSFFLQFCPDIKANSGISDSYEYERPTIGLLVRDHLLKFIVLFAIAIMLMQSTLITLIVKSGNAVAYGAKYYIDNTDFVGHVNTWTTAGKDYDPRYDELTTEGRNKQKLYNSMYVALKREFPRERTEEFLGLIGTAVATEVQNMVEEGKVLFSAQNFIPSVDIVGHDVVADESDVMYRHKLNVSRFIEGTQGLLPPGEERYMYISILQYNEAPTIERGGSTRNYPTSWNNSGGVPTRFTISKKSNETITPTTPPQASVTIEYTGGRQSYSIRPNYSSDNLTVDFSSAVNDVRGKMGENDKITRIYISNLGGIRVDGEDARALIPEVPTWVD